MEASQQAGWVVQSGPCLLWEGLRTEGLDACRAAQSHDESFSQGPRI